MIEYIRGQVISKVPTHVVMETGGIGYRLFIPVSTFEKIPDHGEALLLAHLYVREDEMRLYGFATPEERELFELLMSVPGIGPSTALMVLSSGSVAYVRQAICQGKAESLQKIKGIGKKTAQRIVLELKGYLEHVPHEETPPEKEAFNDAFLALVKLGYTKKTAEQAVQKADDALKGQGSVEDLVRESLKYL